MNNIEFDSGYKILGYDDKLEGHFIDNNNPDLNLRFIITNSREEYGFIYHVEITNGVESITTELMSYRDVIRYLTCIVNIDEMVKELESITPCPNNNITITACPNNIVMDAKEADKHKLNIERTRLSKNDYYLNIAFQISLRSTCLRRMYGAVIVKNDEIISTGYNGAPRGRKNCSEYGRCFREENNIPSGQMYEKCRSCHAEQNAIISASRSDMIDSTLYLNGINADGSFITDMDCCSMCKRFIINAGIKNVIMPGENGRKIIDVYKNWVLNDDSLTIHEGY